MPKRKVCSVETAFKLEENRKRAVFENPPVPSEEREINVANALKWHSWGWNKVDCYSKAGIGKNTFVRSAINTAIDINMKVALDSASVRN